MKRVWVLLALATFMSPFAARAYSWREAEQDDAIERLQQQQDDLEAAQSDLEDRTQELQDRMDEVEDSADE